MSKQKPQTPIEKHRGHHQITVRCQCGPHRAQRICLDCGGAWVKWVATKN